MVSIPKITNNASKYVAKNVNRVSHTVTGVSDEIKGTSKYFRNNAKDGWHIGTRLAKIKKMNTGKSFLTKLIGAFSKTKIKQEHLPTILGGVGTITPIPGGTIIGFGLGKIINKVVKLFH